MNDEKFRMIASQLRKPSGKFAVEVGNKMNEGNLLINKFTHSMLNLKNDDKVLEIGMGNGFFVKDIFELNNTIKYCGCDYSEIMIEQARMLNQQLVNSGQAEFHLSNACNLPFSNEMFDKVFSINTIYFWEKPNVELSEIHRVLKSNGKIIISIRPKSSMQKYPFIKYGFIMYSKEDLKILLEDNNFQILNFLEKEEPTQDIDGNEMKVDTLIVCAEKINTL